MTLNHETNSTSSYRNTRMSHTYNSIMITYMNLLKHKRYKYLLYNRTIKFESKSSAFAMHFVFPHRKPNYTYLYLFLGMIYVSFQVLENDNSTFLAHSKY